MVQRVLDFGGGERGVAVPSQAKPPSTQVNTVGAAVEGAAEDGVAVVGVELDGGLVGPAGQFCSISSAPEAQSSSPSQRRLASMHRPSQANAPSMHTASVVGAVFGDVRSIEVLGHQRKLSCHDNFTMCVMFDSMRVRKETSSDLIYVVRAPSERVVRNRLGA